MSDQKETIHVPDKIGLDVIFDERGTVTAIDIDQWQDWLINTVKRTVPEDRHAEDIKARYASGITKLCDMAKVGKERIRKNRKAVKLEAASLLRALAESIEKGASK